MNEHDTQNPIEIEILRNISFLNTGKNRLWCNVAIIEPVKESLPGCIGGLVRGFQNTSFESSFTRFYGESEKVEFRMKNGGPHGELRVGDEVYHVEAKISEENGKVLYEARKFSEGYSELWEYLSQFVDQKGVICARPFDRFELSDLARK